LAEFGVDPAPFVALAGLDLDVIGLPDNRIAFNDGGRLLTACVSATGCRHFGLILGQRCGISNLGQPGALSRHAPDVGHALRAFVEHQHLSSLGAVAFLSRTDHDICLHYAIYALNVAGAGQIEAVAIAVAFNMLRELCGPQWRPEEINFAFSAPADPTPFRHFFKPPVRFGTQQTAIIFAERWPRQPVQGAEPRTYSRLQREIAAVPGLSASAQVQRAVRILIEDGRVSGDRVAAILEVNRRTLSRRLQKEGETLRSIVGDVEFSLAHQLLSHSDTAILDIAFKLGYSDASAFTRAFRRWTGITPGQWRLAAQQRVEPSRGI
jgi:AraC-like DNA-binding protein